MTGYICHSVGQFVECIKRFRDSSRQLESVSMEARKHAESTSWDSVFSEAYHAYDMALDSVPPLDDKLHMLCARVGAKT